jgi:hypothetical protein
MAAFTPRRFQGACCDAGIRQRFDDSSIQCCSNIRRQIRWPDKTDYETVIGFYQILNQGNGNLSNRNPGPWKV